VVYGREKRFKKPQQGDRSEQGKVPQARSRLSGQAANRQQNNPHVKPAETPPLFRTSKTWPAAAHPAQEKARAVRHRPPQSQP
jgi:hypothetical protein